MSRGCALVSIRKKKAPNARLAVCICVCTCVSVRAHTYVFVDVWCAYVCCAVDSGSIRKDSAQKMLWGIMPVGPREDHQTNKIVTFRQRAHRSAGAQSDVSHGYSSNLTSICISVCTHTCVCVCVCVCVCYAVDSRSPRKKMSLFVVVISLI